MPVFNLDCLTCGPDDTRAWEVTALAICDDTKEANYICQCPDCQGTQVQELGIYDESDMYGLSIAGKAGGNIIHWSKPQGAEFQGDPVHESEVRAFREQFSRFGSVALQDGRLVPIDPEME